MYVLNSIEFRQPDEHEFEVVKIIRQRILLLSTASKVWE